MGWMKPILRDPGHATGPTNQNYPASSRTSQVLVNPLSASRNRLWNRVLVFAERKSGHCR